MRESGKSLSNSKRYCSVLEKISKINDVKQNEKHPFKLINYFYSSNNTDVDKSKSNAMAQRIH